LKNILKHTKILTTILLLTTSSLFATDTTTKPTVKASMLNNSEVVYHDKPSTADSISGMFDEGKFYGRLRSNTFYFWWDKQDTVNEDTHTTSGLGGSVNYKSATYKGFDFGAGLYYSHGIFQSKEDYLLGWKAGKDVFNRYDYAKTDNKNIGVLGEAYLRYHITEKSEVATGRQLVEGFYTKTNDTKMIPNTFDGVVFKSQDISKSKMQLSYLAQQKLRHHSQAHAILMRGDCVSDNCSDPTDADQNRIASWSQNDDSAMHRGLTYSALKAKGKPTDAPLITGDFTNKSIENLKIDGAFYVVPELISQVMGELNYKVNFSNFSITPAVRYVKQFDNGAGEVGGASLSGKANSVTSSGYKNPDSLDSQMIGARVVTRFKDIKINIAYTHVLDEADLVTPWRGFATKSYTRSMARYNWKANTKSYRIELVKAANKTGIYEDMYVQTSLLYQDDDEAKHAGINTDSIYAYIGLMKTFEELNGTQIRFRVGYEEFLEVSKFDNADVRFEVNYFF